MPAKSSYGPPGPPNPNRVRVNVAGIIFTGARNDYNPPLRRIGGSCRINVRGKRC